MNTKSVKAREDLPNMPEEVFEIWFDDRIEANGWPPQGYEWQSNLFNHGLDFLKNLSWTSMELEFPIQICHTSQNLVTGLLQVNVDGVKNNFSDYIADTKVRFHSIMSYVKINKSLPQPLVLLKENEGFQILDGSHRLSVLVALHLDDNTKHFVPKKVSSWVAINKKT